MKTILFLVLAISVCVFGAIEASLSEISINTIDSIPTSLIGTGYNSELIPPVTVSITETSTTTTIPLITRQPTNSSRSDAVR